MQGVGGSHRTRVLVGAVDALFQPMLFASVIKLVIVCSCCYVKKHCVIIRLFVHLVLCVCMFCLFVYTATLSVPPRSVSPGVSIYIYIYIYMYHTHTYTMYIYIYIHIYT